MNPLRCISCIAFTAERGAGSRKNKPILAMIFSRDSASFGQIGRQSHLVEDSLSMVELVAVFGSPRRRGNTSLLLQEAIRGAREEGAQVDEILLRDLKMSPCLEIYGCKQTGRCAIKDDFQGVYDKLLRCRGLLLASPIFFYTVSAHTKILMDRCQSLWVKKYWLEKQPFGQKEKNKKGLFIAVGATKGKKLFDGTLLTVRYFFDSLDMNLWRSLLYRGLDFEGDVSKHPEYLQEAYTAGRELCQSIREALEIGNRL